MGVSMYCFDLVKEYCISKGINLDEVAELGKSAILAKDYRYRMELFEEFLRCDKDSFVTDDIEKFLERTFPSSSNDCYPHSLYRYSSANETNLYNLRKEIVYLNYVDRQNDMFEGLSLNTKSNGIVNSITKMVCFSAVGDSPLMWGHYAESGKGICVEYDFNKLEANSQIRKRLLPVIYVNNRPDTGSYDDNNLDKYIQDCLLCDRVKDKCLDKYLKEHEEDYEQYGESLIDFIFKYTDWSYEKEWRIIYDYHFWLANKCKNELDIKNCIKNIYLGPRLNDNLIKAELLDIANEINCNRSKDDYVQVIETKMSEKQYRVEPNHDINTK